MHKARWPSGFRSLQRGCLMKYKVTAGTNDFSGLRCSLDFSKDLQPDSERCLTEENITEGRIRFFVAKAVVMAVLVAVAVGASYGFATGDWSVLSIGWTVAAGPAVGAVVARYVGGGQSGTGD